MGVLAEYLRTEADQLRAEAGKRGEARTEWLSALLRLYQELEQWAADADGGLGLLERFYSKEVFREPRVGVYESNVLLIGLGNRWAKITPLARYVVATIRPAGQDPRRADGMVEIKGDTIGEYYLFRLKGETGDRWFIQSVGEWNRQPNSGAVEPLTRDRFEAAILSVLQ